MRWVSHPLQPHCPDYFREAAELHQFPHVKLGESNDNNTSGLPLNFAFERTPNLWTSDLATQSVSTSGDRRKNSRSSTEHNRSIGDSEVFAVWDRIKVWAEHGAKNACGTYKPPTWVLTLSELEQAIDGNRASSHHRIHDDSTSLRSSSLVEHQRWKNHAQNHMAAHPMDTNSNQHLLKYIRGRSHIYLS